MMRHCSIPLLPPHLWQAAFYLDMLGSSCMWNCRKSNEVLYMACVLSPDAEKVIIHRNRMAAKGYRTREMMMPRIKIAITST